MTVGGGGRFDSGRFPVGAGYTKCRRVEKNDRRGCSAFIILFNVYNMQNVRGLGSRIKIVCN